MAFCLLLVISCEENSSEPEQNGYLSGRVTVDDQGVDGVIIDVSNFHVSGGDGSAKTADQFQSEAAGDYTIELVSGTYRADYTYYGGEEILTTARYPITIEPGETTYVGIEMKDPIPHSVFVMNGNSAVDISWESAYGATEYRVYRAESSLANYLNIARVDTASGTISHSDMPPSVGTYNYYVTSISGSSQESAFEDIKTVTFTASITSPTGLLALDQVEYVSLSWNENQRADSYKIYRSQTNDDSWGLIDSTDAIEYEDTPSEMDDYYYRVASVSIYDTESEPSSAVMVNYDGRFDPVEGVSLVDRGSDLYLNWLDYDNVAYYSIYRTTDPEQSFTHIDSTVDPYYADSPVDTGTYYYYVTAIAPNGLESDESDTVHSSFDGILDYPSGFTVVNRGLYVELNWIEVDWAGAYILFRSDDGEIYVQVASIAGSITTYNDSPQNTGEYHYRIATETIAGEMGELSPPILVNYTDNLLPPEHVEAENAGTFIDLKWNKVFGASGYKIYRAHSEGGSYEYIDSTWEDTTFADSPEIEGAYYYKVKAFDSQGHISLFSDAAYVYFNDQPLPPYDIVAVDSLYKITLNWQCNETDADFLLYRSYSMDGNFQFISQAEDTFTTDWPPVSGHYFYKLRTIADNDTSDISDFVHVLFSGDLEAPQNLIAYDAGAYVQLEWSHVEGAFEYHIYISDSIDGEYVYDLSEDDNYAAHIPDSAGIFYYKVKALTIGDLSSPFSNAVQVEFAP